MTYTSKESSEQVELDILSKSIGYCMKNERFGPDSDRHSDRRLSLPAQRQLQVPCRKTRLFTDTIWKSCCRSGHS